MGQEASKAEEASPLGGEESIRCVVKEASHLDGKQQRHTSNGTERRSSVDNKSPRDRDASGAGASKEAHGHKNKQPIGPQWMRPSQTRAGTQAEVRKAKQQPSMVIATKGRPSTTPASLEHTMTQLLQQEESALSLTPEEKQEETKKELIHKLNSFLRRSGTKLSVDVHKASPVLVPTSLPTISEPQKKSWLTKLRSSKQEALDKMREQAALDKYMMPMSQEEVGSRVEQSLGSDLDTFGGYQGTVNRMVEKGLDDNTLDHFLFDEETERQLTTYEKWAVIRHAAEQVLQVYANRSNARWIEMEQWAPPEIVDSNTVSASVYANAVDSAISQGLIALLFIDDGRMTEVSPGDVASLLSTDLWQAIKEMAPHRVPTGQRLERLSLAGRHLLQATVSVEMWYGAAALRKLKFIVAIDSEQEHFLVNELQQWRFFGLDPKHLVVLPLPRFHGFAQDQRTGRLAHVKGSARLLLGTGYAMFLLNSPAEAYTIGPDNEPQCLQGSVLDWLREVKANWLFTGMFSDIERLRPEAMFDVDFLAAAMYASERSGANMAMEVVLGESERDARRHDSIVLGRQAQLPATATGNCQLRPSAMRTVRSYQTLQAHLHNPHGFYVSTQRYVFKVSALQRLLVDAAAFHADVQLHGFYAYAFFDIGDITTFQQATCACILGEGLKGPAMSEQVYGKSWLSYAASVLEMQDKVAEFRQKAIDLVQYDKLSTSLSHSASLRPGSTFKERRSGFSVVLLLSLEHHKVARSALKIARLFVHNIVDRLHLVMVMSSSDSKAAAQATMEELVDKELEFNGQLVRETLTRLPDMRVTELAKGYCSKVGAGLVVVPSLKLCNPTRDLGTAMSSLAYLVAKNLTDLPVCVVKANTVGKFANTPGRENSLTVMCHLENTQVDKLVQFITQQMLPNQDLLYLAKTQAFERPGQLSMRSRRMFVRARMALVNSLKVEERAYQHAASAELPKAVEAEGVDLLMLHAAGELPISKDMEEVLKLAKTSVCIFRNKDVSIPHASVNTLVG